MTDFGVPGIVLMENAARGIAMSAESILSGLESPKGPVSIVCGPGNNGGDGFAVARHLLNAGIEVRVHLLANPAKQVEGGDSAVNLAILGHMGVPLHTDLELQDAALVIDALFGTGLARELREPYRSAVEAINGANAPVLAVDIPSGLDADEGFLHGIGVRATATATMVAPKVGFALRDGPHHCGRVEVIDIGVPRAAIDAVVGN